MQFPNLTYDIEVPEGRKTEHRVISWQPNGLNTTIRVFRYTSGVLSGRYGAEVIDHSDECDDDYYWSGFVDTLSEAIGFVRGHTEVVA